MNPYNETQDGKCAEFVKQSEKTIAEIVQEASCTSQMTPEQQRIAIAEACGWKCRWQNQGGSPLLDKKPKGHCWEVWQDPKGQGLDKRYDPIFPPDYLNDLNAMHRAEKVLTEGQFQIYLDWLDVSCGGELELSAMIDGPAFGFGLIHATAAQRAEAFLRTLNLWNP